MKGNYPDVEIQKVFQQYLVCQKKVVLSGKKQTLYITIFIDIQ